MKMTKANWSCKYCQNEKSRDPFLCLVREDHPSLKRTSLQIMDSEKGSKMKPHQWFSFQVTKKQLETIPKMTSAKKAIPTVPYVVK